MLHVICSVLFTVAEMLKKLIAFQKKLDDAMTKFLEYIPNGE